MRHTRPQSPPDRMVQRYRKDIPMKAIVVAALIAGFSTVPGVAAPIDLSAQTCKQFQASSPDESRSSWPGSTATTKTRKTRRSSTPTNSFPTPRSSANIAARIQQSV